MLGVWVVWGPCLRVRSLRVLGASPPLEQAVAHALSPQLLGTPLLLVGGALAPARTGPLAGALVGLDVVRVWPSTLEVLVTPVRALVPLGAERALTPSGEVVVDPAAGPGSNVAVCLATNCALEPGAHVGEVAARAAQLLWRERRAGRVVVGGGVVMVSVGQGSCELGPNPSEVSGELAACWALGGTSGVGTALGANVVALRTSG